MQSGGHLEGHILHVAWEYYLSSLDTFFLILFYCDLYVNKMLQSLNFTSYKQSFFHSVFRKSKTKHGHANGGSQRTETVSVNKYKWTHEHISRVSLRTWMYIHLHDDVLSRRLLCGSPSWTQWVNLTPACMTCTGCPAMPTVSQTHRHRTALYDTFTHRLIYYTYRLICTGRRTCVCEDDVSRGL